MTPPRYPPRPVVKVLLVVLVAVLGLVLTGAILIDVVCDGDGFSCTG